MTPFEVWALLKLNKGNFPSGVWIEIEIGGSLN